MTLPSDNVKKYADKNAFNRNFTAPQEVKPAESVAVSTPVETPKADEGTYVIQAKDNYYKITKNFGISQKDLFALNPGLEEKGLQPGDVIKVKKSGNVSDSNVKILYLGKKITRIQNKKFKFKKTNIKLIPFKMVIQFLVF